MRNLYSAITALLLLASFTGVHAQTEDTACKVLWEQFYRHDNKFARAHATAKWLERDDKAYCTYAHNELLPSMRRKISDYEALDILECDIKDFQLDVLQTKRESAAIKAKADEACLRAGIEPNA